MSAIDTALHAAAEAIRALPDRELVALALAAPVDSAGQAQTVMDSPGHARPVTARATQPAITIRLENAAKEAATRSPDPTRAVRHLSRAPTLVQVEAQRRVLNALRDGPLGYAAIQRASGLKPGGGMQRMMQSLIASGQIAKSPVGSYVLTGTLQPDQPERPWQDATALVMARLMSSPATHAELMRDTGLPKGQCSEAIRQLMDRMQILPLGGTPTRYRPTKPSPNGASPSVPPSPGLSTSTESP